MKLMLHACCGPCSLEPSRILREQGHELTIFYANSNIAPDAEYRHRLETLRAWARPEGIAVQEGIYDQDEWQRTAGRIGKDALDEARARLLEERAEETEPHSGNERGVPLRSGDGNRPVSEDAQGMSAASVEIAAGAPFPAESGEAGLSVPKAAAEAQPCAFGAENERCEAGSSSVPEGGAAVSAAASVSGAGAGFGVYGELTLDEAAALAVDPEKRAARCRACYRLRLQEAARQAAGQGFEALSTTLAVSPYQYTDIIYEELQRAAAQAGLRAVFEDFRPYYPQATRRSRELGMYRQNYCGCLISDVEARAERAQRKAARLARRAAEQAAHAEQRAAEQLQRQARKAERAAYDAKQAKKRAILKALRQHQKNER